MSEQTSTSTQLNISMWGQLPAELRTEFCRQADPATAIIILFTDKYHYNQDHLWHNIATQLKLDVTGKIRDVCIKWLKIHRHILQIYGDSDSVTVEDWSSYFKRRHNYLFIEETFRQKFPTFKFPLDYLEWLILGCYFKKHGEHHRSWDWQAWWGYARRIRQEDNSLWIEVATRDKHDMFINCDTRHKLFGCTVDCYDVELEYQDFNDTWNNWLAVITRDSYTYLRDPKSYRRNLFGEKITSFE